MPFINRVEAARRLAARLAAYRGANPLVLAIPRGAAPMAHVIANALDGELDVVLVRKLGAPGNPELAIGSVTEDGCIFPVSGARDVDPAYVEAEARAQLAVLRRRRELYARPPVDARDRIAIVVDDGLATGATMLAALRAVRARGPRRLIAAAAVASRQAEEDVRALADEVVLLEVPRHFVAVAYHFDDFSPVTDAEVVALLEDHQVRSASDSRATA